MCVFPAEVSPVVPSMLANQSPGGVVYRAMPAEKVPSPEGTRLYVPFLAGGGCPCANPMGSVSFAACRGPNCGLHGEPLERKKGYV